MKRITELSAQESRTWEQLFGYWVETGQTNTQADALAWGELQDFYPRLKTFDGCR